VNACRGEPWTRSQVRCHTALMTCAVVFDAAGDLKRVPVGGAIEKFQDVFSMAVARLVPRRFRGRRCGG
jgi:hypothetical protein